MKKAKIISTVLLTAMLLLVSGFSFAGDCDEVYAQESACEDVCFEPWDICVDLCADVYIAKFEAITRRRLMTPAERDAVYAPVWDEMIDCKGECPSGYTCAAECESQFYTEECPDPDAAAGAVGGTRNGIETIYSQPSRPLPSPPPSIKKPPVF